MQQGVFRYLSGLPDYVTAAFKQLFIITQGFQVICSPDAHFNETSCQSIDLARQNICQGVGPVISCASLTWVTSFTNLNRKDRESGLIIKRVVRFSEFKLCGSDMI